MVVQAQCEVEGGVLSACIGQGEMLHSRASGIASTPLLTPLPRLHGVLGFAQRSDVCRGQSDVGPSFPKRVSGKKEEHNLNI